MKTAYIIFRDIKPLNNKEILNTIIHFCREHDLHYFLSPDSGCSLINIDGYDYCITLQENREGQEAPYWIIYCLLKGRSALFRNIA